MSHYELLGVPEHATVQEIRDAYRKIALRCHPDRAEGSPENESLFHEATTAYRLLSDPEKRRRYDIENGLVDSVADLFSRHRVGKAAMKAMLPSAKNAPRAGRTLLRTVVVQAKGSGPEGAGRIGISAGAARLRPVSIEAPPAGSPVSWYQIDGLGEPGKNGGEPGSLWLMILSRGETDGT